MAGRLTSFGRAGLAMQRAALADAPDLPPADAADRERRVVLAFGDDVANAELSGVGVAAPDGGHVRQVLGGRCVFEVDVVLRHLSRQADGVGAAIACAAFQCAEELSEGRVLARVAPAKARRNDEYVFLSEFDRVDVERRECSVDLAGDGVAAVKSSVSQVLREPVRVHVAGGEGLCVNDEEHRHCPLDCSSAGLTLYEGRA